MPEQQQQPQPDLRQILSLENAGFVAVVLNEAGQGLAGSASRVGDDERRHLAADTPAAPPNSPSASTSSSSQTVFDFPEVDEDTDVSGAKKPVTSFSSSSSSSSTRSLSLRKRRRIPSFNKHRVTPKVSNLTMMSGAEDADDEASDDNAKDVVVAANDIDNRFGPFDDSDAEAKEELSLKLRILAESQKSNSGKRHNCTDWAKVGQELRQIADSFQGLSSSSGDTPPPRPNGVRQKDLISTDVLSIINTFLPISIPQSLWSAIVSYAAWKILRRLQ